MAGLLDIDHLQQQIASGLSINILPLSCQSVSVLNFPVLITYLGLAFRSNSLWKLVNYLQFFEEAVGLTGKDNRFSQLLYNGELII